MPVAVEVLQLTTLLLLQQLLQLARQVHLNHLELRRHKHPGMRNIKLGDILIL